MWNSSFIFFGGVLSIKINCVREYMTHEPIFCTEKLADKLMEPPCSLTI